jgi:hypothetical protein
VHSPQLVKGIQADTRTYSALMTGDSSSSRVRSVAEFPLAEISDWWVYCTLQKVTLVIPTSLLAQKTAPNGAYTNLALQINCVINGTERGLVHSRPWKCLLH